MDAAPEGEIELVTCPALLAEVADVLDLPRLRKRVTPDEVGEFDVERWSGRDELCHTVEGPTWDRFWSFGPGVALGRVPMWR